MVHDREQRALAGLLAVLTGVLQIGAGVLRVGTLVSFISAGAAGRTLASSSAFWLLSLMASLTISPIMSRPKDFLTWEREMEPILAVLLLQFGRLL